jgi:hypothetical protein
MAIGRITGQMLSANLARSGTDLTFETNLLALDVTNSRVGVGTASPATTLHISSTDAVRLPSGNSAQRPGSPANGDIRYNSDTGAVEGYASGWLKMTGGTALADADADTQIEVERTSDEDAIHVQTAGVDRAHFRADGTIEMANLKIDDMTISSLTTNGNIAITPNGTGTTTVTNLVVAGSFDLGDLDALNVGDINIDSLSSDDGNGFDLLLDDNKANAMEIKEGSNVYMNFATTDSSELITVSKNMTIASGITLATDTADINGGAIDGTAIGANSASTAVFTNLTANGEINIDGNGGGNDNIDNVIIGANTAAAGTFTTATATNVQATNYKANDGTAAMTIADSSGDVNVSTNFSVDGNLTVNGTTTTIDSATLTVEDPLIQLAKNNSGGSANTFDQGLFFNRGSDDNVSFIWDESEDQFALAVTSGEDGTTAGNITIDSYAALKAGVTTVSDLETGVISAADGTESATIANSTGVMTIASSVLTTADINGGSLDGVTIGAASAAAATVSSLSVSDGNITNAGDVALDTISADGTTIGITLTDNTAAALDIKEGSNSYLKFDTTNSSELITASQAFTVASGVTFTTDTADINGGAIDGTTIGANSAAAGTFTTATATSVNATNIRANDGTAAIVLTDSTGAVAISTAVSMTGAVDVNGGNFTFNEGSASVDARFESNGDTHALFIDGSEDHVGVRTSSPAYDLDVGGSTDALRLPNGTTSERPTGAPGLIRFNTTTGKYEGCQDGSTYVDFATAGDAPTFTKESTTGDGSTTTFTGFFSSAPESANNVFVYIDNVYQEPTENYSVSGTNITFTSAPHSGARIFAITGADNSALVTGGVARSETSAISVSGSSAVTIMSFNAATYRSAELFITVQDSGNTQYSAMKATVLHDGSTAYGTTYAVTNTAAGDIVDISFEHDGSNTVNVQATALNSGTQAVKVQYSLAQ